MGSIWGGNRTGMFSAIGAMIGTIFAPGIGTAIGAGLGAAVGQAGVLGNRRRADREDEEERRADIFNSMMKGLEEGLRSQREALDQMRAKAKQEVTAPRRFQRIKDGGRRGTILTGPLGIVNEPSSPRRTLLGG